MRHSVLLVSQNLLYVLVGKNNTVGTHKRAKSTYFTHTTEKKLIIEQTWCTNFHNISTWFVNLDSGIWGMLQHSTGTEPIYIDFMFFSLFVFFRLDIIDLNGTCILYCRQINRTKHRIGETQTNVLWNNYLWNFVTYLVSQVYVLWYQKLHLYDLFWRGVCPNICLITENLCIVCSF